MTTHRAQQSRSRTGDLAQYLEDLERFPPLEPDEVEDLTARMLAGDDQARTVLIERNLRFVYATANRFRTSRISFADLVAAGNLGLCKAAEKFDPARGVPFLGFAQWWVRREIVHAMTAQADSIPYAPKGGWERLRELKRYRADFEKNTGRRPSPLEMAEGLACSLEMIESLLRLEHPMPSLSVRVDDGGSESVVQQEQLDVPVPFLDPFDSQAERRALLYRAFKAASLMPREIEILKLCFGLGDDIARPSLVDFPTSIEGYQENSPCSRSLDEVAALMNVSRERVRQIRDRALNRIKNSAEATELLREA